MIAVCNTTPLRYLIAIGQDDLLGKLFEKVFVPRVSMKSCPQNAGSRAPSRVVTRSLA